MVNTDYHAHHFSSDMSDEREVQPMNDNRMNDNSRSNSDEPPSFPPVSENIGYHKRVSDSLNVIMNKPKTSPDYTMQEFLTHYAAWNIHNGHGLQCDAWQDLMKRATPPGMKKRFETNYNENELVRLIDLELQNLLRLRNYMRHILSYLSPVKNKKLILDMTAHLMGEDIYQTGGGATKRVKRIETIYYQESNIKPPANFYGKK